MTPEQREMVSRPGATRESLAYCTLGLFGKGIQARCDEGRLRLVEQIGCGWQVLHVTTAAPILLTVVWIYQCYTQHLVDKEKEGEKGGGGEQRKPVSPTLSSYSAEERRVASKAVEKLCRA